MLKKCSSDFTKKLMDDRLRLRSGRPKLNSAITLLFECAVVHPCSVHSEYKSQEANFQLQAIKFTDRLFGSQLARGKHKRKHGQRRVNS